MVEASAKGVHYTPKKTKLERLLEKLREIWRKHQFIISSIAVLLLLVAVSVVLAWFLQNIEKMWSA